METMQERVMLDRINVMISINITEEDRGMVQTSYEEMRTWTITKLMERQEDLIMWRI
jgi:hypothetical protein